MATTTTGAGAQSAAGDTRTDDGSAPYLIWSNEHLGWWGRNEHGYTMDIKYAGRYSRERAIQICKKALYGRHRGLPYPELAIAERDALDSTTMEFR